MKKVIYLLFFIPIYMNAQSDTLFTKEKAIKSINERGINNLVSKYEKILRSRNGIQGWRLQLKFKAKETEIMQLKLKFMRLYPKIPILLEYQEPYYRIRVGNCRTKLEAIKIKHLINKQFPNTYPVPEIIDISKIK